MTNPLGKSLSTSALASLVASEKLTAGNLFSAIGGVRGVIESTAPGFLFLVVFTVTGDLYPSVIAPVVVAIAILLTRLVQRLPVLPAVSGGIGIALSAGFAMWTGRAEDNFVGGFIVNAVSMTVMLVSIVIRRPLIGVATTMLASENPARSSNIVRRAAYLATVVWASLFALRLLVQVPLYLAQATAALAATKLLMGLPLYAALLWLTWLMMRSALNSAARQS
jgi:hypothetical protein